MNNVLIIHDWVHTLPGLTPKEYQEEFVKEQKMDIKLSRVMEILNNLVFVGLVSQEKQKGGKYVYFPRMDCV